jgi:hypothetical protein
MKITSHFSEKFVALAHHRIVDWPDALRVLGVKDEPVRRYSGLLYFARATCGTVKIGCSEKPLARIAEFCFPKAAEKLKADHGIDCSSIRLLVCINGGAFARETSIHRALRSERVAREWFAGSKTEQFIESLLAASVSFGEVRSWPTSNPTQRVSRAA